MGNTSTKERSMTPPHGGHHHLSSTALSSRRNGGGNNGGPSSSGRLSSTLLSSGGAGGSESYSTRGRSRHNLESSLFGLGLTSRETRERDREAEKEAREQRKIEREKERLKERERSLREESVDGGFLVTQGVYTGVEDFKDKIVRHLMIERRLAPFFKGLNDHEPDWTDAQLVAAVKGLPIPSPDAQTHTETKSRSPTSRSRAQSYTSEGSNRSATSTPSPFGFSSRARAKTLSISAPRNPTLANTTGPAEINEPSITVDDRPIEAVLYKNATECPICFLYYPPYLNKTRCCDQDICSECFVQIKRPDPHHPEHHDGDQPTASDENALTGTADQLISEPATCPFCVEPEFGVIYTPPPFRRGLMFANSQSQNQTPSPMNFGFADGSSSSLPGHYSGTPPSFPSSPITPTGKRRLALGVNNPEVVTTDRIRPDWSQKLNTARSHAARRAAAATALHTAAYLMGPHNPPASSSSTSGGFSSRRLIRRAVRDGGGNNNLGAESDTPSPAQSGTGTPRDGHGAGGLTSLTSFTERLTGSGNFRDGSTLGPSSAQRDSSLFNERRSRVIDLEEMMLMEAIRLSLAEEEERKRKVELEEQKKRLAAPSISTRNGSNISLASSSGSVEGKGKSVDRSLYPQASTAGASSPSAATTNSRPQLTSGGSGSGSGSGASDTSSFRSLPGSDDEGMASENAGSGTETMFNFRSLAEMIVEEEGGRVDVDGQGEFVGLSRDEREGKEDAETAEHVEDVAHDLRANGKNVTERATEA